MRFVTGMLGNHYLEIDLFKQACLDRLKSDLHMAEAIYSSQNMAFCLFALDPEIVLYTNSDYHKRTSVKAKSETTGSIRFWLANHFPGVQDVFLDRIFRSIQSLVNLPNHNDLDEPFILVDFSIANSEGDSRRTEMRITRLLLNQKSPRHVFFCSHRDISHLVQTFSNQVKLVFGSKVLDSFMISFPVEHHPLLKELNSIELKIFTLIFNENLDSKAISIQLNFSLETIKSHRKKILQKTGFSTIEALSKEVGKNIPV